MYNQSIKKDNKEQTKYKHLFTKDKQSTTYCKKCKKFNNMQTKHKHLYTKVKQKTK